MKKKGVIARLVGHVKNGKRKSFWIAAALLALALGLSIAGGVLVPIFAQKITDALIAAVESRSAIVPPLIVKDVAWLLAIGVAGFAARELLYNYFLFRGVIRDEDGLRHESYEKFLRLPARFHHENASGEVMSRLDRGAGAFYTVMNDLLGQSLLPPVLTFGTLAAVLFKHTAVSAVMAPVMIVPMLLFLCFSLPFARRLRENERRANKAWERLSKNVYDVASNVRTVKKFAQESFEIGRYKARLGEARETQIANQKLWKKISALQGFVTILLIPGIVMYLAVEYVVAGKITVGEFGFYVAAQAMISATLAQIFMNFPRFRENTPKIERLFEIMDEPLRVEDKPNARPLPPFRDSIRFEGVSFSYDGAHWALQNITLAIPKGSTVAVVGPSGAGKTTLARLLSREDDPRKGAVTIDGIDIREITQKSLRRQAVFIPQDAGLFNRTIAENIAYGKPEATEAEIVAAAKAARAHDFIMELPKGYATEIGERGVKLSGGQCQRIAIARAIILDPPILICDEATNQLDAENERLIQATMDELIRNRTTIIIAHRFSTIVSADMIAVLRGGKLEAIGPHRELIETSPTYRKLYELQFDEKRFDTENAAVMEPVRFAEGLKP